MQLDCCLARNEPICLNLYKFGDLAIKNSKTWVPHGVEVERWLCNPRVSGSNPDAGNLEKVVYLDENSWTHTKT